MYQKQQLRLLRQDPNAPVVKAAGEREIEKAWAESDIKDWLDAFGQASVQRERESRMNIEKSRLGLAGAKADLNLDIQRRQLASGLGQQKKRSHAWADWYGVIRGWCAAGHLCQREAQSGGG